MRYILALFLTTPAAAMTVQGSLSVTGTGNTTYSVTTSSGVNVQAGTLTVGGSGGIQAGSNPITAGAAAFSSVSGNGSALTSLNGSNIGSGTVGVSVGGTGLGSAGGTANRVLRTSNGTSFTMGQVIGPDIAGSTIPLNAINQSGATDGQVMSWSNANQVWQPANSGVSGGISGVVPVFTSANGLSTGNGFITSVSSGVAISTNITLGVNGSSVTILVAPGSINHSNIEVMVASADVTNVSTVTFSNLLSSTTYRLEMTVYPTAANYLGVVVDNSQLATYQVGGLYWNSGVGPTNIGAANMTMWPLGYHLSPNCAGQPQSLTMKIFGGGDSRISGFGSAVAYTTNNCNGPVATTESYTPSDAPTTFPSALSSISVVCKTSKTGVVPCNFWGHVELWQGQTHP